jgi:ubiquinone/menaquinone biosynthesis C-methylase UbiE
MGKYLTWMETDFIFNSVDPSQTHTIMDVGAETDRFSLLATDTNAMVISKDIDFYGLKKLKLKTKHVNVIQADTRKIPLKDETIDAISMIEVLDYIPEVDEALRECYRTLKSNVSLILSFGDKSNLKSKLRELHGKSYGYYYGRFMQRLFKTGSQ